MIECSLLPSKELGLVFFLYNSQMTCIILKEISGKKALFIFFKKIRLLSMRVSLSPRRLAATGQVDDDAANLRRSVSTLVD
jgi:hypothetical protein